jgi:RNase P subunit RPR2
MATDSSKLQFLEAAAYLLAVPSPTISATLGAARDRVLESQDVDTESHSKEWDAIRRQFCGACGSVMIPGWSCEVRQENRPTTMVKGTKKDTLMHSNNRKEKDIVYICSRCNRKTAQPLRFRAATRPRGTSLRPTAVNPIPEVKDSSLQDATKVVKSANSSSKQRAKARKGGLQAMLAQSKNQGSASKGLDLMDFMQ